MAALTTVVLATLEAIDRRHPFHVADHGVRAIDRARSVLRL